MYLSTLFINKYKHKKQKLCTTIKINLVEGKYIIGTLLIIET